MRAGFVSVALLLIGCASAPVSNPALPKPDLRITQMSRIAPIATHQSGAVSVQFRVDIANRTKDPMQVRRVDLQTLGTSGTYNLPLLSKPYAIALKPGESTSVELAGPAYVLDEAMLAANGPVTLRLVVDYTAAGVPNQTIDIQRVFPPED